MHPDAVALTAEQIDRAINICVSHRFVDLAKALRLTAQPGVIASAKMLSSILEINICVSDRNDEGFSFHEFKEWIVRRLNHGATDWFTLQRAKGVKTWREQLESEFTGFELDIEQ